MKYIDRPTMAELSGTSTAKIEYSMTEYDLVVSREDIEAQKDKIEEKTGVFHWKDVDGEYKPVNTLTDEKLQTAYIHCELQMDKLNTEIQNKVTELEQTKNRLEVEIEERFEEMCKWQYKLEKLEEEASRRETALESIDTIRARRQKNNRPNITGD